MVWNVDDNKVAHKDPKIVTQVIDLMKEHFGDLKVTRGNKNWFFGMNNTINKEKSIEIEMKEQLLNVIETFILADGQDVDGIVTSTAQKHLREVNSDCKPLSPDKADIFHSVVATLL